MPGCAFDPPTGLERGLRHTGVCAELGAPIGQVLFSPDGTTVAALEDMAQTFRGRLWLISTDDGAARRVPPLRLSTTEAKPPASTDESTPSTSDFIPSTTESIPPTGESVTTGEGGSTTSTVPPYVLIAWTARGSLLAVIPSPGPGTTHLAEIDPTSDRAADLGSIAGKAAYAAGTLLTGGGIAVLPVISSGTPHQPQLVVVDLDSRSLHTVALTGDMVTASTQAVPLALAPDGHSALLWMVDPVTFTQWPPVWADLDTGALTVVPGTEDLLPDAAAVSPDGSQLALIARARDDDTDALRLLSVDGGTSRTLVPLDQPVTPGNGLAWTRTNLLVPDLAAGMHSLNRIAPIQLSG